MRKEVVVALLMCCKWWIVYEEFPHCSSRACFWTRSCAPPKRTPTMPLLLSLLQFPNALLLLCLPSLLDELVIRIRDHRIVSSRVVDGGNGKEKSMADEEDDVRKDGGKNFPPANQPLFMNDEENSKDLLGPL